MEDEETERGADAADETDAWRGVCCFWCWLVPEFVRERCEALEDELTEVVLPAASWRAYGGWKGTLFIWCWGCGWCPCAGGGDVEDALLALDW